MIVIYDFDQTMAMDGPISYLKFQEKLYPINMLRMKAYFAQAIDKHGRYARLEELIQGDAAVRAHLLEEMNRFAIDPGYALDTAQGMADFLTFLRFLFNVNQRQVKRELCDMLMDGESDHHHHHEHGPDCGCGGH
ncbi:MAG: hypothetical protein LDL30_02865 [Desulfovibrio sp.]|nr:hypothetical protein [Desulfovibrio sp.]MCA1985118.1 hypothetical protein [Desulfovibrio sp.]